MGWGRHGLLPPREGKPPPPTTPSSSARGLQSHPIRAPHTHTQQERYLEIGRNVFNLDFHAWVAGFYDLVTPYRKAEMLPPGHVDPRGATVFADPGDFVDRLLDAVSVDSHRLGGFAGSLYAMRAERREPRHELFRRAQQLDYYYACLVKGAAVRMGLDRVWTSAEQPMLDSSGAAFLDDSKFVEVIWNVIKQLQPSWALPGRIASFLPRAGTSRSSQSYRGGEVLAAVGHMKEVRSAMIEVWRESKRFRVSDEVHMVEVSCSPPPSHNHGQNVEMRDPLTIIVVPSPCWVKQVQVLERLCRDGMLGWLQRSRSGAGGGGLSTLQVCHWFRRSELVRAHFAMTVGKRLATEALVATSNGSIMAHQRTVSWSEREYMSLAALVQRVGGEIEAACGPSDARAAESHLFVDYAEVESTYPHRDAGERALADVALGRDPGREKGGGRGAR